MSLPFSISTQKQESVFVPLFPSLLMNIFKFYRFFIKNVLKLSTHFCLRCYCCVSCWQWIWLLKWFRYFHCVPFFPNLCFCSNNLYIVCIKLLRSHSISHLLKNLQWHTITLIIKSTLLAYKALHDPIPTNSLTFSHFRLLSTHYAGPWASYFLCV